MVQLQYDGSFEGLLTAVFVVYEYSYKEVDIKPEGAATALLFGEVEVVYTDADKAWRVLHKVEQCWGKAGVAILLRAFLSAETQIENHILEAVRLMVRMPEMNVLENFGHQAIAHIQKVAKSVSREVHRMKEFVRFERVGEVYFAQLTPQYDVLPLVIPHFKNRFSDQQWIIYDLRRCYGFVYDLEKVTTFTPANKQFGKLIERGTDVYEQLWKTYFRHINIVERKNSKYQMRNMPKRYWRYLTELKD